MLFSTVIAAVVLLPFGFAQDTTTPTVSGAASTNTDGLTTSSLSSVTETSKSDPTSSAVETISTESSTITTDLWSSSSSPLVTPTEIPVNQTSSATASATDEEDTIPQETRVSVSEHGIPPKTPDYTIEEVTDLTAIQIQTYADTIVEGSIPTDQGETPPPVVLPYCPDVAKAKVGKRAFFGILKDREPRPVATCIPRSLQITVAVWYVLNGVSKTTPTVPAIVRTRIINNMDFLNTVFAPLKITFNFDPDTNLQARRNKAFSNHMTKSRGNNEAFQRVNRLPGNDVLNIWVVNSIDKDPETGKSPGTTGYSFIPSGSLGSKDGVVIRLDAISPSSPQSTITTLPDDCKGSRIDGQTLVHEVGHWMGLEHIFGSEEDTSCNLGDSIADTSMFPNTKDRYCCRQTRCGTKDADPEFVINWMSYSLCAGTKRSSTGVRALNTGNSFTPGQKSVMYAAFSKFRRATPCSQVKNTRSLKDRQEDTVKRAEMMGQLLLQNCSVAIQDVFIPDTIPLPPSALSSLSSAAIVLKATPPPQDPLNPRPATKTVGTLTSIATSTPTASSEGGSSTGDKKSDGMKVVNLTFGVWYVIGFTAVLLM